MAESYTAGFWKARSGEEQAFAEAWREFAEWASGFAGTGTLHLLRDMKEPNRYISFASWESLEAIQAWKGSPEFKRRKVKEHTAEFTAAELELETKVPAGERTGAT